MLPTARTLEECRKRGWRAGVVERWKPGFRKDAKTGRLEQVPYGTRVDFLGFADLMVLDGKGGYLAIQACAGGDLAKRLHKALSAPELKEHLEQGNRFQVWGWRELKSKPGRRKWYPKIVSVVLRDGMLFHEEIVQQGGDAPGNRAQLSCPSTSSNPAGADSPGLFNELFTERFFAEETEDA